MIQNELQSEEKWYPLSLEYCNYALALVMFSIRYSAVFWDTSKHFSLVFSLTLAMQAVQYLIFFPTISIIYKIKITGAQYAILNYQNLLLNGNFSIILYIISCILIFFSSIVLYIYGYCNFIAYQGVPVKNPYLSNISAMILFVLMTTCTAPIMVDCVIIYMDTMNTIMIIFVIFTVLHLFFWIFLWVIFTVMPAWRFKLRFSVSGNILVSNNSINLVYDIHHSKNTKDTNDGMMIVMHHGNIVAVQSKSTKKQIMQIVAKYAMEVDQSSKGSKSSDHNYTAHSRIYNTDANNSKNINERARDKEIDLGKNKISTECIYAKVNKHKTHKKEEEKNRVVSEEDYETVS